MKYIITENRLNDSILKYIEEYYNWDELYTEEDEDYEGNLFVINTSGDYTDVFYYDKTSDFGDNVLLIYDTNFIDTMNGLFSEHWIPIFKNFVEHKFEIDIDFIKAV
jgi:hypothetical protein